MRIPGRNQMAHALQLVANVWTIQIFVPDLIPLENAVVLQLANAAYSVLEGR